MGPLAPCALVQDSFEAPPAQPQAFVGHAGVRAARPVVAGDACCGALAQARPADDAKPSLCPILRYDDLMSFWSRLAEFAHRAFDLEAAQTHRLEPGDPCAPDADDVGFTIAVVGLAAKMARADGCVTRDEVETFLRVFKVEAHEEGNVRRVFDIARQSVAGHEAYARQIARRYRDRPCLLEDVLDGLYAIARADGMASVEELEYLDRVGGLLGLAPSNLRRIRAAHLGPEPDDPYAVLGVAADATDAQIRRAWTQLASNYHPDAMAGRGAPAEFLGIAHDKMAAINTAYHKIMNERRESMTAG
jgi:DnaJ like chaperone protein